MRLNCLYTLRVHSRHNAATHPDNGERPTVPRNDSGTVGPSRHDGRKCPGSTGTPPPTREALTAGHSRPVMGTLRKCPRGDQTPTVANEQGSWHQGHNVLRPATWPQYGGSKGSPPGPRRTDTRRTPKRQAAPGAAGLRSSVERGEVGGSKTLHPHKGATKKLKTHPCG